MKAVVYTRSFELITIFDVEITENDRVIKLNKPRGHHLTLGMEVMEDSLQGEYIKLKVNYMYLGKQSNTVPMLIPLTKEDDEYVRCFLLGESNLRPELTHGEWTAEHYWLVGRYGFDPVKAASRNCK